MTGAKFALYRSVTAENSGVKVEGLSTDDTDLYVMVGSEQTVDEDGIVTFEKLQWRIAEKSAEK